MPAPGPAGEGDEADGADGAARRTAPRRSARRGLPRRHALALGAIALVGLARGLFWSSATVVFNPIDEQAHFAYVESMATTLRPPVVGRDRLSAETLALFKRSRTAEWRPAPVAPDPADDRWGLIRESYEGVQGPAYYALMALPYRLAHPFGPLTALYAVRVATLLLALTAVPVAYLLARDLLPHRRDAWLAAPALLVVLQGFNANLASATNDALVVPLAGATLLAVARARRSGLTVTNAVVTGALLGVGLSTKSHMVALFPIVAAAAIAVAAARRDRLARLVRWGAVTAATATATALPWLAWNLSAYGSLSASEEVDRITGPLQPHYPLSLDGLRLHLTSATTSFWDFQLTATALGRYMWTLSAAALLLTAGAVAVLAARRRWAEAGVLAWLGSSWFVTLAMMLAVVYGVFGGRSSVVGRHLYPSLVAVVVAAAAGAFVVGGRRLGWGLLLVVANLALTFEQPLVHARLDRDYAEGLIADLVPVVDQSWGEGLVAATAVGVSPPCPAEKFAVGFFGPEPGPPTLALATAGGPATAIRTGRQGSPAQYLTVYDLPAAVTGAFTIALDGAAVSASSDDRDPSLTLAGQPGDPVARVFCRSADPKEDRFAQRFSPDHASFVRRGHLTAWPTAWAWAARIALAAFVLAAVRDRLGRAPARPTGSADG